MNWDFVMYRCKICGGRVFSKANLSFLSLVYWVTVNRENYVP